VRDSYFGAGNGVTRSVDHLAANVGRSDLGDRLAGKTDGQQKRQGQKQAWTELSSNDVHFG